MVTHMDRPDNTEWCICQDMIGQVQVIGILGSDMTWQAGS